MVEKGADRETLEAAWTVALVVGTKAVVQSKSEDMAEVELDRRVNIGHVAVDILWGDKDLMENAVDFDEDVRTVPSENSGMTGLLVNVRRTLARLAHSYGEMQVGASVGDHSSGAAGIGIGMALGYGCRTHSAGVEVADNTMVLDGHMAAVGSS
jgi:hypothetical protein